MHRTYDTPNASFTEYINASRAYYNLQQSLEWTQERSIHCAHEEQLHHETSLRQPIPHLMDVDPTAPFEFHFLTQEMTWDPTMDFPTFITTTDKLAKYRTKEYQPSVPVPVPA